MTVLRNTVTAGMSDAMTPEEIHARLKDRFGEAVAEWRPAAQGESWVAVSAGNLVEMARFLRDDPTLAFDFLRIVSGVDRGEHLSSMYHLYSYTHFHSVTLRVDVPREAPLVPSVAGVWSAAEWHERESFDMVGLEYEGHPNPRRILLPEDWEGYPLRKDYETPKSYGGLTNE